METAAFVDSRQIGAVRVTVLSDGAFTWAPQLSAPEAAWRRAMPEANAAGEVLLGHNMVLIQTARGASQGQRDTAGQGQDGAAILVDAGLDDPGPESPWMPPKAQRSPGVQEGLARLGLRPEDITHVLLTHAHGDHIAGATVLRDGQRVPRYPRARYLLARRDWDGNPARQQPDGLVALHLGTLERLGRLDIIGPADAGDVQETEIVPGVMAVPAPGDSRGHHIVRVESEGQRFYATGDLFHHACEVEHPDWVSPNRDPASSRDSRLRFIAEVSNSDSATVVYSHAHFPPWGKIVSSPSGAKFVRDAQ